MKIVLVTNTEDGTTVLATPCPVCSAIITDDQREKHLEWHNSAVAEPEPEAKILPDEDDVTDSVEAVLNTFCDKGLDPEGVSSIMKDNVLHIEVEFPRPTELERLQALRSRMDFRQRLAEGNVKWPEPVLISDITPDGETEII